MPKSRIGIVKKYYPGVARVVDAKKPANIRYEVPIRVARELVSFDRNHNFAEGEYKLNVPCPSLRLGADKRKRNRKKEPNTRKLGSYTHRRTAGVRSL